MIHSYKIIFLIFLVFYSSLAAQSKKKSPNNPPATLRELPDSRETQPGKHETDSASKRKAAADSSRVIPLSGSYQPVVLKADSLTSAEEESQPELNSVFKYRLGYGSFRNIDIDLLQWQKFKALSYQLQGLFYRTDGQFLHNQLEKRSLAGKMTYRFILPHVVVGNSNYDYSRYELQAAPEAGLSRIIEQYKLGLKYAIKPGKRSSGLVRVNFDHFSLHEEHPTPINSANVRESTIFLLGKYFLERSPWKFNFEVSFLNNQVKNSTQNAITDFMSTIGSEAIIKLKPNFSLSGGLRLQNLSFDNRTSESFIAPFGELNYAYKNWWGFQLHISRGYNYETFTSRWELNPYLMQQVLLKAENQKLHLAGSFEFKPSQNFMFKTKLEFNHLDNFGYFKPDSYLFDYGYLSDLKQVKSVTEIEYQPVRPLKLILIPQISHYEFPDPDIESATRKMVPYLEKVNIIFKTEYQPVAKTKIGMTFQYIGPRFTTVAKTDELEDYILVNFEAGREYNRYIQLYFNVYNILNQNYQIWNGYRELGIHLLGGIRGYW
ncbi:TonB-dependent receptor [candidate division KSB1 bacterium]|nr:TonB-dependent receptor [candidate division KSB1 bacterium]